MHKIFSFEEMWDVKCETYSRWASLCIGDTVPYKHQLLVAFRIFKNLSYFRFTTRCRCRLVRVKSWVGACQISVYTPASHSSDKELLHCTCIWWQCLGVVYSISRYNSIFLKTNKNVLRIMAKLTLYDCQNSSEVIWANKNVYCIMYVSVCRQYQYNAV